MMVGYEKENNYRINVCVKHHNEYELIAKDYENVYPKEYDCTNINELLDLEEVDDVDCKWFER